MIHSEQREPTSTTPKRFAALLRGASEMIGAQIELRIAGGAAAFSQSPTPTCIECSRNHSSLFRECMNRRQEEIAPTIGQTVRHWTCAEGCDLLVFPVGMRTGPDWLLIAVRPPAEGQKVRTGFDNETLRFLRSLADLLAEHLNLSNEVIETGRALAHRSEELDLLQTISGRLTKEDDLRRAIREILSQTREALGADAALVSIQGRKIFETSIHPIVEESLDIPTRSWRQMGERLSDHLIQDGRRYYSGRSDPIGIPEAVFGQPVQLLAVGVRAQEEIEGCLGLIFIGKRNGSRSNEIRLLDSLAERLSTVLANLDLYENLRDFLMATVKSLVSAIDAKDPYTSGHSERVNILSMLIGKTMGLDDEELERLRWASILHDIGKIGMPESILNKKGLLTPEEYEIVKQHPDRGYRVLAPIRQLAGASMGVRCHHERVDGRGYPLGLRGDEIPLTARIIAVADTYDALTSTRSYRRLTTPDKAFSVIEKARGTQVDGSIVDVLEQLMPFIREHQIMLQPTSPDDDADAESQADPKAA